jgi:hypothetical protein
MPTHELCNRCSHFLPVPLPANEGMMYFCGSEDTKEGPQPIGFIRYDAPACAFFSSRSNSTVPQASCKMGDACPLSSARLNDSRRAPIIMIAPPAAAPREKPGPIEVPVVQWILSLTAIISLIFWAVSHISTQMAALPFRLH